MHRDPHDPYYISPEEERALEAANECDCDHGRVLVFRCKGHCECGMCPEVDVCPKCVGQIDVDEEAAWHAFQHALNLDAEYGPADAHK
jgi:hypothetical protein